MSNSLIERPAFYEGQILEPEDLSQSVGYGRDLQARHERYLHTWGIAAGFTVEKRDEEFFLMPGVAIDSAGIPIVLTRPLLLNIKDFHDEALPGDGDNGKFFPLFVTRKEMPVEPGPMRQRCGSPASSRIQETVTVRYRPFATDWDAQDAPPVEVGADGPLDPNRVVLVGFLEWKEDPAPYGSIGKFEVRHPEKGIGPRYAGVAADDVMARGGELALWSRPPRAETGTPAVILGSHLPDNDPMAFTLGLDDGKGKLNEILSVDPKGNLKLKGNLVAGGKLSGRLTKGDVAIESGVAGDGMVLPLPAGITQEQIDAGDAVLHTTITPRYDRQADPRLLAPGNGYVPIVLECSLDADRRVHCLISWYRFASLTDPPLEIPGTGDYILMAYVSQAEGGES
jgi:hypothetical protein